MYKISPCLWFNNNTEEAVNFYASAFRNVKIGRTSYYDNASSEVSGMKEGSILTIECEIEGMPILALNGGPVFTFSPATSLSVMCGSTEYAQELWDKLSEGGSTLMEFQKYPFAERYGWLNDKFGVSWQITSLEGKQKIVPSLLFVGDQYGRAEEAMKLYTSIFPHSKITMTDRYDKEQGEKENAVRHGVMMLDNTEFIAMDSGMKHDFNFTQAMSFTVDCKTQKEVDMYWEKLGEGGEYQPCGWLLDKFGVSWQIVPSVLNEMMADKDPVKAGRAMKSMLTMSKLDIAELQRAYEGK